MIIKRTPFLLSILFFASLGFGQFGLDHGFTIKPYMFIVALIFIYNIFNNPKKIKNFFLFEYLYILFLIIVGMSLVISLYPSQTIKFTIGAALLSLIYLTLRFFYTNHINFEKILRSIAHAGVIVGLANLAYYLLGIIEVNFSFVGNNILHYGLMVDRGYPRLIGTASGDPNFTAVYLSIFFFFYLLQKGYTFEKILYFILIVLTFSRGAYVSIILALAIYYLFTNRISVSRININRIGNILLSSLLLFFAVYAMNAMFKLDIASTITSRAQDSYSDNGSGRTELWKNAYETYQENPLYGIGANSTLEYNTEQYDNEHYTHNTYLETLSELGIFGFFIFISSMALALRAAFRNCKYNLNYSFLLYLGILLQMVFLSMMVSEIYLIGILTILIFSQEAKNLIINNKSQRPIEAK